MVRPVEPEEAAEEAGVEMAAVVVAEPEGRESVTLHLRR